MRPLQLVEIARRVHSHESEGMNWTTEKPTRGGWYWYRDHFQDSEILLVHLIDGRETVADFCGTDHPVILVQYKLAPGEWAGPVEPPLSRQNHQPS